MFRYTLPSHSRVFSERRLHSLTAELELPDLRPLIWHIWLFIFLIVALVICRIIQFYPIYRLPRDVAGFGGLRRRESNERSLSENDALEHMADGSPEFYEWLRRRNLRQRLNNPF